MSVGGITLRPREQVKDGRGHKKEKERRDLEIAALARAETHGLMVEDVSEASVDDLREFLSLSEKDMQKLREMAIKRGDITLGIIGVT